MIGIAEEMFNLIERMDGKVAREMARPGAQGVWSRVQKIRGAVTHMRGKAGADAELRDYLLVSFAGDPPPKWKGTRRKIWITAVVESKSPTNALDAFEQLRNDVRRIKSEGIVIDGTQYKPDEIKIEMPKVSDDPADWATELVAVLPREIKRGDRLAGRQATAGTVMNWWIIEIDDAQLDWAAKEAHTAADQLTDVFQK